MKKLVYIIDDVQAEKGYVPFKDDSEKWNTHDDGLDAGFINPLKAVSKRFSDKPTALGGTTQSHLCRTFQQKVTCRFIFVRDNAIQYGILYRLFQHTHFTGRGQTEHCHDFFSSHRRLEITDTVFLFQILQFLSNQLEVIQETLFTFHILS